MNNSWKHDSGSKQKWIVGWFKEKSTNNASKPPEHPPNGMQWSKSMEWEAKVLNFLHRDLFLDSV